MEAALGCQQAIVVLWLVHTLYIVGQNALERHICFMQQKNKPK